MMPNSDQMKHTCHSRGCPNSHINTQCSPFWRQCRRVFSHANGHKGAECHPAIDCTKHLALVIFGRLDGVALQACRKLDGHIDELLHMLGTKYRWRVAAFSSGLWNIPTPVDQVLDGRGIVHSLRPSIRDCPTLSQFKNNLKRYLNPSQQVPH